MSEIVNINKDNLIEAYTKGCSDVKATLKRMFPDVDFEPKPKEPTYKVGQYFKGELSKTPYRLMKSLDNESIIYLVPVSNDSGSSNKVGSGVVVVDANHITEEEFKKLNCHGFVVKTPEHFTITYEMK